MTHATISQDAETAWISCSECGAPCRHHPLPPKSVLRCTRCGVVIRKQANSKSLQISWAFATTGLLLVVLANVNPILIFDVAGNKQSNLIVTGVYELYDQGYWPVAGLVFLAAMAGPALHLGAVFYVLACSCLRWKGPMLSTAAYLTEVLEAWNLVPVYAVATVVAVVKLDMLGSIQWQVGALWILALSICSLLTVQYFDRHLVEERLEELR